ncbi:recombinase family protein [Flavobacterium sp. ABG]|uniref:recombinase family protein n=1 Tax=Flavobacterium sp. ABG TaxID=1423322 RepID=UPI00069B50C6|nr:recombinase family protein [Flavobacterium sp. ABG]
MTEKQPAKYIRISDRKQKTERQQNTTDKLYIDIISGKTKFADRPAAQQLMQDIEAGLISQVSTHEVSRFGRSLKDVIDTVTYMQDKGVNIHIANINMHSIIDGKPNPIFNMIVSILANISVQELETLRERQAEGIRLAMLNPDKKYKGRVAGSKITPEERCANNQPIVKLLKSNAKGKTSLSMRQIAAITNKNLSTVQRVSNDFKAMGGGQFFYNPVADMFAPPSEPAVKR